jgi:hypothetical protein
MIKVLRQPRALCYYLGGFCRSTEGVNQSDFSGSLFETASGLLGGILQTDNENLK